MWFFTDHNSIRLLVRRTAINKRRLKNEDRLEDGVPELQIPGKSRRKARRRRMGDKATGRMGDRRRGEKEKVRNGDRRRGEKDKVRK